MVTETIKTNKEEIITNNEEAKQDVNYGVMDLIECPDGDQAKDVIESILELKNRVYARNIERKLK